MHIHFGLSWPHQWTYCSITTGIILAFAFLVYRNRKKEGLPGTLQNIGEMVVEFLSNLIGSELGNDKLPHILPFLGTFFLFILISNFFLIIPCTHPPTSDWSNTFALAVIVVIALQYYNLKLNGPRKAMKLWLDPVPGLGKKDSNSKSQESVDPKDTVDKQSKGKINLWKFIIIPFFIFYFIDNLATLIPLSLRGIIRYCIIADIMILAFVFWTTLKVKKTDSPEKIQCLLEWITDSLLKISGVKDGKGSVVNYTIFYLLGTLIFVFSVILISLIPAKHPGTLKIVSMYSLILCGFFILYIIAKYIPLHKLIWKIIGKPVMKIVDLILFVLKQLPVKILIFLFIALHLLDNGARLLSLSLRLFGNIFGEHTVLTMVTEVALKNFQFGIPLVIPFMIFCMDVLFALIQTVVFVLLSTFYFKEELGIH